MRHLLSLLLLLLLVLAAACDEQDTSGSNTDGPDDAPYQPPVEGWPRGCMGASDGE